MRALMKNGSANKMKHLANEYKESSWAKVKHVLFKASKKTDDTSVFWIDVKKILSFMQFRR